MRTQPKPLKACESLTDLQDDETGSDLESGCRFISDIQVFLEEVWAGASTRGVHLEDLRSDLEISRVGLCMLLQVSLGFCFTASQVDRSSFRLIRRQARCWRC